MQHWDMSLVELERVAVVTAQQKQGSVFTLTAPPRNKFFQNPVFKKKKKIQNHTVTDGVRWELTFRTNKIYV